MTSRTAIVEEARRWIGTPYRHQASTIGAGTDCLGLVRGVWRSLFQAEPEEIPPYTPDWSEPTHEEVLFFAAQRHLIPKPVDSQEIGEVILFRMSAAGVAKHLGISATRDGAPTVVHSYTGHGVVESFLTLPWQRKIVARYDFPQGAK